MPYVSDAQRRYFHAAGARGDIPKKTVAAFDRASKGATLPERIGKMAHGGPVHPLATMIVAKMHPAEEKLDEGQMAAAEEMVAALHAKDAKAFAEALCAFLDQYEAKPHEEYGDEGGEGEDHDHEMEAE